MPVSALWGSQWCRTRDTAALFELGPVREVGAFNSFFGTQGDEARQTAAARNLLLGWRERGTLVAVTHQVNIRAHRPDDRLCRRRGAAPPWHALAGDGTHPAQMDLPAQA